jgi:hypothetical protein
MFCAPGLIFGGIEGVGSRFSCFACPDSFSTVPRASGPVLMFCAPGLVFGGTEGVGSRCHVLRTRTRFWRYLGPRVMFSCFALPNSFSAVPRASSLVFMFCAPGLVFTFWASGLIFGAQTHFRRYQERRVPFSCFTPPNSFSTIARASDPDFMFCAPGLVFGGTEGVESLFHVSLLDIFSAVPRSSGLVFMFCAPDSFSAVPWASSPVFMFCVPGLIFGSIEGIRSRFLVLLAQISIGQFRGLRVPI